jgi:hypothetical protein
MPFNARRILKFNPEDESAASVGEDLGEDHQHDMEMNYEDTVLGTNGWLYGIPYCSNRIVRFNPADQTTSTVGGRQSIKSFYVEVVCWGEMDSSTLLIIIVVEC